MGPGPQPHVRLYARRYTQDMKENAKQTSRTVLALALASLLLTPQAPAAKRSKAVKNKANPEAKRLMSEGLARLNNGEVSSAISAFNKAVRKDGTVSTYFLLGWRTTSAASNSAPPRRPTATTPSPPSTPTRWP